MRRETAIYISGYILTIAIAITLIIYFIKVVNVLQQKYIKI